MSVIEPMMETGNDLVDASEADTKFPDTETSETTEENQTTDVNTETETADESPEQVEEETTEEKSIEEIDAERKTQAKSARQLGEKAKTMARALLMSNPSKETISELPESTRSYLEEKFPEEMAKIMDTDTVDTTDETETTEEVTETKPLDENAILARLTAAQVEQDIEDMSIEFSESQGLNLEESKKLTKTVKALIASGISEENALSSAYVALKGESPKAPKTLSGGTGTKPKKSKEDEMFETFNESGVWTLT